ncbi:MAG: 50S ribosomal protein L25 [Nitrospirales bacterium]|nr:50S ribosomal protein L25 [Nitrospirales bacterium]
MERVTLKVEKRDKSGKGVARSLRRDGMVPGVMYKGGDSAPVQLNGKELALFISRTAGEQIIVNLEFPEGIKTAIVKDYQVDPIIGSLLHVDFQEISASETMRVMVHVVITGEAVGVKRDKGVLQHGLKEIEVECLPDNIPGHIDVDVTDLGLGQAIHVRDLNIAGVRVLTEADEVLATVITVREEEAAASAETAEPEVIKKGKKEA